MTTEQSEAFQEELKELRTQFYSDGPIAGKVSLEEGVLLMVDYAQTLAKCVAKKDELVNAEDLFGAYLCLWKASGPSSRRWRRADGVARHAVDAAPSRGRGARHAATPSTRPPESLRGHTVMLRAGKCPSRRPWSCPAARTRC